MPSPITAETKSLEKKIVITVFIAIVSIILLCSYVYAQTSDLNPSQKKENSYYFKKILDNEIMFLKKKIKQQEVEHVTALQNQRDLYDKLLKQQEEQKAAQIDSNQLAAQIEQLKEQLIKAQKKAREDEKQIQSQKQENDVLSNKQKDIDSQSNAELLQLKAQLAEAQNKLQLNTQQLQQQNKANDDLLKSQSGLDREKIKIDENQRKENAQLKEQLTEIQKQNEVYRNELIELKRINAGLQDVRNQIKVEKEKTYNDAQISMEDLSAKLKISEQRRAEEAKDYEQSLIQKELEHGIKLKTLSEQFEKVVNIARKVKPSADISSNENQTLELQEQVKALNEKLQMKEKTQAELLAAKEKQYNEQLQKIAEGKEKESLNREQEIGDIKNSVSQRDSQILALKQQVKDLTEKYEKQQVTFDQIIAAKDKELKEQLDNVGKQSKEESLQAEGAFENKLTDKYKQLDRVVREKEQMQTKILSDKDEEIKEIKAQSLEKEKTLRQFNATKEMEFNREIEKLREESQQQVQSLKKSLEQLKIYQIQLKEELKTQEIVLKEKDNKITNLNTRVSLYSGEEAASQQKITQVLQDDLKNTQLENKRLAEEVQTLKQKIKQQQEMFEQELALKKAAIDEYKKNLVSQQDVADQSLAKRQQTIKDFEQKIADQNKEIESYQKKGVDSVRDLNNDIKQLKKEHEELIVKKDQAINDLENELIQQKKNAEDDSVSQKKTIEILEADLAEQKAVFTADIEKARKAIQDLEQKNIIFESQYSESVAKKEEEIDRLNQQIQEQKNISAQNLDSRGGVIEEARNQVEDQKNKYEDLLGQKNKQISEINKNLLDQKAIFENRLAKQNTSMTTLENKYEEKLIKNSEEWEKKIKLLEAKYMNNLQQVEESKLKAEQEYKKRLEDVAVKLKDKAIEDNELKTKMVNFRQNQVELLEEMLMSKATMMQNLTLDFKGQEKERAQIYFQRAMKAILKKNYASAKYELEQVLKIEPEDQITVDILGSLEFLIGRTQ